MLTLLLCSFILGFSTTNTNPRGKTDQNTDLRKIREQFGDKIQLSEKFVLGDSNRKGSVLQETKFDYGCTQRCREKEKLLEMLMETDIDLKQSSIFDQMDFNKKKRFFKNRLLKSRRKRNVAKIG